MSTANALNMSNLRELIAAVSFRPRDHLPCPDLRSGIPVGALCEVSGPGKTEFVTRFLAANSEMRVAWIEDELSIYPNALLQRQVDLNRILFVEAGQDSYWSILQALRSQLFGTVIYSTTTTGRIGGRERARLPQGVTGSSTRLPGRFPTRVPTRLSDKALRALQLAAEKSHASLILLSDESPDKPEAAWPISLRLRVKSPLPDQGYELEVLKRR
jgi:hypothetical protein